MVFLLTWYHTGPVSFKVHEFYRTSDTNMFYRPSGSGSAPKPHMVRDWQYVKTFEMEPLIDNPEEHMIEITDGVPQKGMYVRYTNVRNEYLPSKKTAYAVSTEPSNDETHSYYQALMDKKGSFGILSLLHHWSVVFLVLVPLGIVAIIMSILYAPECGKAEEQEADAELGISKPKNRGYYKFMFAYLIGWYLASLGDWLQGPNFYMLPCVSLGYAPTEYAIFCVVGTITAACFGFVVGDIADTLGKKLSCQTYCVLYIICNLMQHSPNFWIIVAARVCGGVCTTLLFASFDAWMVEEHFKRNYDGNLLGITFGWMFFLHPVMGIIAGFSALGVENFGGKLKHTMSDDESHSGDWKVNDLIYGERTLVCDLVVLVLVGCFLMVTFGWPSASSKEAETENAESTEPLIAKSSETEPNTTETENAETSEPKKRSAIMECIKICDTRIFFTGCALFLFEAGMYLFVFDWVTVYMFDTSTYVNLPDSEKNSESTYLFAILMVGVLVGACLNN